MMGLRLVRPNNPMGIVPKAGGYKNRVRLLSVLLFYRIF